MSNETTPLTRASAVDYLAGLGLADATTARAEILAGGVSSTVIAVDDGNRKLIVKQALAQLAVKDEWFAPVERVEEESAALRVAGKVIPGNVPLVLNYSVDRNIVVLEHAPDGWEDLRTRLLRGEVDSDDGERLGAILAAWHSGTAVEPMLERFADRTAFEALRIDPFYRVSAERDPEVEPAIEALLQEMDGRQITLVHGDFSPKNILAGVPGELWVIDFEVTHSGDPAFDVAFMLHHLIAKSIHLSGSSDELDEYAQRFYASYRNRIDPSLAPDISYVLRHTGAQLLARVIGKSPAPYLTAEDGERARQLAESTLLDPPVSLQEMLNRRRKVSSK